MNPGSALRIFRLSKLVFDWAIFAVSRVMRTFFPVRSDLIFSAINSMSDNSGVSSREGLAFQNQSAMVSSTLR